MALHIKVWLILRCEEARCGEEALRVFKQLERLLGISFIACSERIFRHGNDGKRLAKHIATLAQRGALGCYREEHVAIGIEAMTLYKVDCALCCVESLLVALYIVVGEGADEGKTALKPHALGGVD